MDTPTSSEHPCGLFRRLAAMFYDSLLLAAVLLVASAVVLPLNAGEPVHAGNPFMTVYMLLVGYGFFGWFWTHGGQTLGMRAWRIELHRIDGGVPGWGHALKRYLAALLSWAPAGLGFLWSLWDPQRRAWHDRLSGTVLVVRPKKAGTKGR